MIGLDTNVIVRYAMRDDPNQVEAADALIEGFTEKEPGYVSHVTLAEVWWVLTQVYKRTADEVSAFIHSLLGTATLVAQNPDLVYQALRAMASTRADFADALITSVSKADGCTAVMTFDTRAAKRAGMTLLQPDAEGE